MPEIIFFNPLLYYEKKNQSEREKRKKEVCVAVASVY